MSVGQPLIDGAYAEARQWRHKRLEDNVKFEMCMCIYTYVIVIYLYVTCVIIPLCCRTT